MKKLVLFLLFFSSSITAQDIIPIKHVDHKRELGIDFNDSMLWEGNHAPTLFFRWNRMSEDETRPFAHAYRLSLNYNRTTFERRRDTNDVGGDSFFLVEPGIEFQRHRNYRVIYGGLDFHYSKSVLESDESDDNALFIKTAKFQDTRYGFRPFVGYKLYVVSTLAISIELGYDYLWLREQVDRKQSFNGSLNDEEHSDVTSQFEELRLPSGIYLSFHF